MSKKTTEQFIIDAIKVHGGKYDYSKCNYDGAHKKVIILCKHHGEYEQKPNCHLSGQGCRQCGFITTTTNKTLTREEVINRFNKTHGNVYNYSKFNYVGWGTKGIIICKTHGEFEQRPSDHLKSSGCTKCANIKKSKDNTLTKEVVIKNLLKLNGDKYNYSKVEYINNSTKMIIGCNIHGDFKQNYNKHIAGQGCPKCKNESHWNRTGFIKRAKDNVCIFYILRCFNEKEEFYKVGITSTSVEKRYKQISAMPYAYEVVSEIHGEAGLIWDLELKEKRKLKASHYTPKIKFNGSSTECFTQYKLDE
jgi:Zn ribbon nucleic-acid-binding protein